MDLSIFIGIASVAVLIQAGVLLGMFLAVRKTSSRIEILSEEVRTKVLPAVHTAHLMLIEMRPKIEDAVANVSETTSLIRSQLERIDVTVGDAVDRTHLQVIRADDLVSRSLDRVEETTDMLHRSVMAPIRQVSGVIQGVTAALEYLNVTKRRRRNGAGVPQDEMFI